MKPTCTWTNYVIVCGLLLPKNSIQLMVPLTSSFWDSRRESFPWTVVFFLSVQYIELQVDRLLIFKQPSNFKFAVSFGRNAMGFLSHWPNRSKVSYGHIAT